MKMRSVQFTELVRDLSPGFASGDDLDSGVAQVRMNNVSREGTWDWSRLRRVTDDPKRTRKYAVKAGDILFNSTNSPELVGKTAYFPGLREPIVFSNHFFRIRIDEDQCDPQFIAWWLVREWQKRRFENLCTRWVNQASVRQDDLLALQLNLPPLPEQRRIAVQLEEADRLRRTRRYTLELSDSFLPATFRQLFGDSLLRLPQTSLAELIVRTDKINYGVVQPGAEQLIGVPIVRVGDMDDFDSSLIHLKRIATEVERKHAASRLKGNEILIACVGATLGKIVAVRPMMKGFNIARAVARVPADPAKINPIFLAHYLLSDHVQTFWKQQTRTVGQPTLNILQIEETPIVVPPLAQQQHFATLVTQHERLRATQRESLRQAEHLLQTLLHRAFSTE